MTTRYNAAGFLNDPADARLIVPKRNPAMGWTLNLARPAAPFVLMALGAVIGVSVATAVRV